MFARPAPVRRAAPVAPAVASPALITVPIKDRIIGARTALILQDLQNDVMMDGGAFAATGSPDQARAQNVLTHAARLAAAAQAKGVMVIHVWMVCEPGHPNLAQHAALMQGLKSKTLWCGALGASSPRRVSRRRAVI
jgi:gluconolactonase